MISQGTDIVGAARTFSGTRLAPIARQLDEEGRFPNELLAEMAEAGLFGINYPAEYGGGAHDAVTACKVIEELGKVSAGVALTLFVHWMVVDIILKFGTDAQKRKYFQAFSAARR